MYKLVMPRVREMDELLLQKLRAGTYGLRLFVQKNGDITEDDLASDFLLMERARTSVLREPVYGI